MPKVTAVPAPTPAPQPTAAPIMPPEESPSQASENAMPVIGAKNTPAPSPRPQSPAQSAAGTGGLSLGGNGDAQEEPGIPSDFQFTYYIDRMLALIESRWYKPPVPLGVGARARFTILRSGKLTGIALEETSGYPTFDRAILRALYAANPLPPLPPAYLKSSLTVHLRFANNG
jgi:TonB family protein